MIQAPSREYGMIRTDEGLCVRLLAHIHRTQFGNQYILFHLETPALQASSAFAVALLTGQQLHTTLLPVDQEGSPLLPEPIILGDMFFERLAYDREGSGKLVLKADPGKIAVEDMGRISIAKEVLVEVTFTVTGERS